MSNEIMLYQTITTIGQAVSDLAQKARSRQGLRRKDLILLEEQLRFLKTACRMKAYDDLLCLAADEMERTVRHFADKGFPGELQEWALEMLKMQSDHMRRLLRAYGG